MDLTITTFSLKGELGWRKIIVSAYDGGSIPVRDGEAGDGCAYRSDPTRIEIGLTPYRDLFPWIETYHHIKEYCTGRVVLEKPSINRLAACLVEGPAQSSINKALRRSPWSGDAVNERWLERIPKHHRGKGLTIGIIDSTFSHPPRGEKKSYGVYRYWDYVNGCYSYALQLVTAAIATEERCDGFDYRVYPRFHPQAELAYLEHIRPPPDELDRGKGLRRLLELLAYDLHRRQHQTKPQLAALIEQMEASAVAPDVYTVDSALFAPVVIEAIEKQGKPWLADSEKTRLVFWQGQTFNCETFAQSRPDTAYRPVLLKRHGQEKTFWVFTCVVRIKKYGQVRLAVIYDQPDRQGQPIYCFTRMLIWNVQKIVQVRCHRWDIVVSSEGHILQSVEVRPRRRDSSLVAWEGPWRESKTAEPSDNGLEIESRQSTRWQRAVNAEVASLHATPVAETVDNVRRQQGLAEMSLTRPPSPAGYQRRHGTKEEVATGEARGARWGKPAEEASPITVSGKWRRRRPGGGSGRSTADRRAAKRARSRRARTGEYSARQSEAGVR